MNILLCDFSTMAYTVQTPYQAPLGGSQSSFCYLAENLAARGHRVVLATAAANGGVFRGVDCRTLEGLHSLEADGFAPNVIVALNSPRSGPGLQGRFGAPPRVLLTTHAADQPDVRVLVDASLCERFDAFVFLSEWQRREFRRAFALPTEKTFVLTLGIAPAFENQFQPGAPILACKNRPPVIAYLSTPFRGLDLLVAVFPWIRRLTPGARLKVFSSMKVYQSTDESAFTELYERCRQTEGVEYVGSIAQPQLAQELRSVTMLAYPNTFPETACIAAMEAMASGCLVVTSDLGALPETIARFGSLIEWNQPIENFAEQFARESAGLLQAIDSHPQEVEAHLHRQVAFANARYSWKVRAAEWEAFLFGLVASR